jgi:hypothetical protein
MTTDTIILRAGVWMALVGGWQRQGTACTPAAGGAGIEVEGWGMWGGEVKCMMCVTETTYMFAS